ncbi:MAG: helicase HerA-like domain-containing protein, partial [Myxococcota bacterium]
MSASLFLGRTVDDGQPYSLKAKTLRTHGLIVGMTGSGKTGMALVALEELVRSGVPVLAIDPKGDLANLGLVFRGLSEEGFAAWSDGPDGASLSTRWREGVESWGLTPEDATTLADQMAVTLYTPGSEAGIPVDVLGGLQRPDEATLNDAEALRALVSDTISGLLGLTGHEADPVRDPAHIVLSTLLEKAWREGTPVDLATLITQLIDPPFETVGVFPVDRFFPPDDRMNLAMALNGLIASPSFASWTKGAPLDIGAMLEQGDKTRVSIFSIAHLSDDERQFFLSMFLGRVLAWTRTQPGTEQLRAVLFFDEVAGWLPPHPKNPASKRPLLLLMKQARAMGLGVLLATQNPVDVDYKAVSNAGLWCVGKLRTSQDRARLLKGIPGEGLDEKVASLGKREFLMARASGEADVVASRHALCFLRGPFTRTEVKQFQETLGAEPPGPSDAALPPPFPSADRPPPFPGSASPPPFPGRATPPPFPGAATAPTWCSVRPPLDLPQWYLDPRVVFSARMNGVFTKGAVARQTDGVTAWAPAIYACFQLRYDEDRAGFIHDERLHRVHFPLERLPTNAGIELPLQPEDLVASAQPGDRYAALPQWMDEDKELKAVRRALIDGVYRTETTGMFVNRALKLKGRGGET